MKTEITDSPEAAARFIRAGGLVAFPTETVYGLGADIFNETALAKIFEAKRRPADNPLIVHISDLAQIAELAERVSDDARKLIDAFFPGPLTVVLHRSARVPDVATAGLDTVGLRMPENDTAKRFLLACATPVAAPSANLSGRPSPTDWESVLEDLNGRIDCVLKGGPADIGLESTVVDCTTDPPVLLRSGAVSLDVLRTVVPGIGSLAVDEATPARSPGMRYKHYAPEAVVELIDRPDAGKLDGAFIGLEADVEASGPVLVCDSVDEYASRVFAFFRECDRSGIRAIYCQTVPESGIGAALMDRLRRASRR